MMSGAFTTTDEKMAIYQDEILRREQIRLEVSACAGFEGLMFAGGTQWESYLKKHDLTPYMDQAVHIVWGTGGGLMP